MRQCTRCPFQGEDTDFSVKIRSSLNGTGVCKPCKAKYNESWYSRNKVKHIKNVVTNNRRYQLEIRETIDRLKDRPCTDCGNRFPPYVMDFDHIDPDKKSFTISKKRGSVISIETLLAEIAKCEVVCANCHRIRTHLGRRPRSLVDKALVS